MYPRPTKFVTPFKRFSLTHLLPAGLGIGLACLAGPTGAAPADLDTGFNGSGIVVLETISGLMGVISDADGKAVAVGQENQNGNPDGIIVRYNTDGTPDTGFAQNGYLASTAPGNDGGVAVLQLADGSYLSAGVHTPVSPGTDWDADVVHISNNGTLDLTFAGGNVVAAFSGTARGVSGQMDVFLDLAVQNVGGTDYIVAGGFSDDDNGEDDGLFVRFHIDGTPDDSFHPDPGRNWRLLDQPENNPVTGVAVDADGKILLAGEVFWGQRQAILLRQNTNGSGDSAFGQGGFKTLGVASQFNTRPIVLDDGSILVAGTAQADGEDGFIAKFNPNGSLAEEFGNNGLKGIASLSLPFNQEFYALAVDPSGRIVAVGDHQPDQSDTRDVLVARFLADGTLDASFGTNGYWTYDSGGYDEALGVAVQSDGKILVVGQAGATGYYRFDGSDDGHGFLFRLKGGEPSAVESLITHYYNHILDRAPDQGGRLYWDGENTRLRNLAVESKETFILLAVSFFNSAEYLARNTDDATFLGHLYRTFFNREADQGGLDYWLGQIDTGLPRGIVLLNFLFSTEFSAFMDVYLQDSRSRAEVLTVMDFYRGILNRIPETEGLDSWAGQFRSAQCLSAEQVAGEIYRQANDISWAFLNSSEYTGRNRTNDEYVSDLYNAFMRRGGDLSGVQYWIGELDGAAQTREQLRKAFIDSPEFGARVQAIVNQGCAP